MHKFFFPIPGTYAVIQLDIRSTLECLDSDTQALEAARTIQPAKCLVYLHNVSLALGSYGLILNCPS